MAAPDRPEKKDDAADALANLADGQEQSPPQEEEAADPAEALGQLGDSPDPEGDEGGVGLAEPEADEELEQFAAAAGGGAAAPAPRRAVARVSPHAAHNYRKTMIPLLLVVGGLVVLVALASIVMLVLETEAERLGASHGRLIVLTVISLPLGALLLFGAWHFWRDVRRHAARGAASRREPPA